jgi:hypothetical protein
LLTQALAAHQEAKESFRPSSTNRYPPKASTSPPQSSAANGSQVNDGVNTGKDAEDFKGKVAMIASGHVHDGLVSSGIGSALISPTVLLDRNDMNDADSRLASYRDLQNNNRGRGTSLERTEKEKRVQDSPKGTYSTNPGDTALPPSPATPNIRDLDSISSNQPTEGVRAKYRLWRDSRHGIAPEKAWSIGEVGTDDLGGQVERSIKDAMAGIEPNNRSRKSSHSLRFFKEGLPDDTTKKRGKSQGRSKEGILKAKHSPVSENPKQRASSDQSESNVSLRGLGRVGDSQSPLSSPHESSTKQPGFDLTSDSTAESPSVEGYFDISRNTGVITEDQVQTLPLALLAEIRNNHNLTPGASKGSSFSRSIPVTESERPRPENNDLDFKPIENELRIDEDSFEDDHHSPTKNADDEDESGEEQISSALFVPHKTPRESPKQERNGVQRAAGAQLNDRDHTEASTSQEWLEEYQVPLRDVDQKYLNQEHTPHLTPLSPTPTTPHSPYFEKNNIFTEPSAISDTEQSPASESGYSTAGDEASITDDQEVTPTGSLKPQISGAYSQHIQEQQNVPRQPVEAIELIPYRHQVGGHTTMWRFSKRAVCKQLNNRENEFYEKIERDHPDLLEFLPRYV